MADEPKKYEVVIVFSGLIAIGPPLPTASDTDYMAKGPLFGVMPLSGRRPITIDGKFLGFSPVHLPVIFTTTLKPNKSNGFRPPDELYRKLYPIWYPMRERLYITIDGSATPGSLEYVHDPDYGKPGKLGDPKGPLDRPIDDFAAIPDLRKASPPRCKLRGQALAPDAKDVAAQIFVPSGKLRSGADDARMLGRVVRYGSSSGSDAHEAVVVPQVRVTVGVDAELTITSRSLDTGGVLDSISFVVDRAGEIWIGNIDADDIEDTVDSAIPDDLELRAISKEARVPSDDAAGGCDIDFARIYDLTEGKNDVVIPCDDSGELGERKCFTVTVDAGDDVLKYLEYERNREKLHRSQ